MAHPIKVLTVFTEDFASLWSEMWFENPEEKRKTNAYRLKRDLCQRPHHPPQVFLRLPQGATPDSLIGQLVNLVITEEVNARGTQVITKIRVFPATLAKSPKYNTFVIGDGAYGKCEPGRKFIEPNLDSDKLREYGTMGHVWIYDRFKTIWLNLRTYSSTGRAWREVHILFATPDQKLTYTDYWHGMNKLMHDNIVTVQ